MKPNAPYAVTFLDLRACPLGIACPEGFLGLSTSNPPTQSPSGCSSQPVPVPQRSVLLSAGFATSCCFHGCIPTSDTCKLWLRCFLLFASSV